MSRLDKLKEQHPDLNISIIDILATIDPTTTYKYLDFLIKTFKNKYIDGDETIIGLTVGIDLLESQNIEILNEFDNHCKAGRIKNSDISGYESFNDMAAEVMMADDIIKQKKLEKKIKKIYVDDEWLALIPLSFEASKVYGANTKWCTTNKETWDDYIKIYKLIYIINKVNNTKCSISIKKRNGDVKGWLADDTEINPMLLDIPIEIFAVIIGEIKKLETNKELMGDIEKPIKKVEFVVKPIITYDEYFTKLIGDDIGEMTLREYENKLIDMATENTQAYYEMERLISEMKWKE